MRGVGGEFELELLGFGECALKIGDGFVAGYGHGGGDGAVGAVPSLYWI